MLQPWREAGMSYLETHWFNLLQTIAIVAGLFFTGRNMLIDARSRRVQNLFAITQQHRSIWSEALSNPKLLRVLSLDANLRKKPVTLEERIFINLVILHVSALFDAVRQGLMKEVPGQDEDLKTFFSLPIPNTVWNDSKTLRHPGLAKYIDSLLAASSEKPQRSQ